MLSDELGGGIFARHHLYVMGAIHFYHFTFVNPAYKYSKILWTSHSCSVQICGHYVFFNLYTLANVFSSTSTHAVVPCMAVPVQKLAAAEGEALSNSISCPRM